MNKRLKIYLLKTLVTLSVVISVGFLVLVLFNITVNGVKGFNIKFFQGIVPIFLNTMQLVFYSMALSVPLALASSLYLCEYATENWFTKTIRFCSDALAGVPSIIFGLVGMSFFVRNMGFGFSLHAGAFTIAILILPTLLRTFEEILKSVPDSYKAAALALGATKLRAIFTVVLPSIKVPILSSIMLALGRVVGETAALVLTMGTASGLIMNGWDSGRTLSVHMFLIAKEAITLTEAYASALLLLIFVALINFLAYKLTGEKNG